MSAAFNKFLAEFHATGRQKLDGYTLQNLDLLEPEEKRQAIDLLKGEVLKNAWGIDALARLDEMEATNTLKSIEATRKTDELYKSFEVFYWLWKLTGSEEYAEKFSKCRPHIGKNGLDAEITKYYLYASNAIDSPAVEIMLRGAVFTETDEAGLGTVARTLLNKYGIRRDNDATKQIYLEKWRALTEGSPAQKKSVLDRLI